MTKILTPLLGLFLVGCSFQTVKHDPGTAVLAANVFLKAFYIEHNYEHALMLSDAELRRSANADDLGQMARRAEQICGSLKELKAESYLMTPGKTMELFYIGRYQRGTLYHRVVLVGDVSNGYRVSGIWFQDSPYPESKLRRPFQPSIVVN
jgi:hypothetical protein